MAGAVIARHDGNPGSAEVRGNQQVLGLAHPAADDVLNGGGAGDLPEHMGGVTGGDRLSDALQGQRLCVMGGDVLANPVARNHGPRLRPVSANGGEAQRQGQQRRKQMLSHGPAPGGAQLKLVVQQPAQALHPLPGSAGRQSLQRQISNAEADGAGFPVAFCRTRRHDTAVRRPTRFTYLFLRRDAQPDCPAERPGDFAEAVIPPSRWSPRCSCR